MNEQRMIREFEHKDKVAVEVMLEYYRDYISSPRIVTNTPVKSVPETSIAMKIAHESCEFADATWNERQKRKEIE